MSRAVYVIAGSNGAGKTTFAKRFLPDFARCDEFVNPDLIAAGLSPFAPRSVGMQAARLVLKRIRELCRRKQSFGFESTLSGKTYLALLKRLRKTGYRVHAFYLWLPNEELAIERVNDRARQGGHSVPVQDIRRRYRRGLRHFLVDYQGAIDDWILFDNSAAVPEALAFGAGKQIQVIDPKRFQTVQRQVKIS